MLFVENFYASNYHLWFQECTSYHKCHLPFKNDSDQSFCYSWKMFKYERKMRMTNGVYSKVMCSLRDLNAFIYTFRTLDVNALTKWISFSHDYKHNFWNTKLRIALHYLLQLSKFSTSRYRSKRIVADDHHEYTEDGIFIYLFVYIWLPWVFTAAHGLTLVAGGGGYPLVAVGRLLIAVASLMEGHRL